MRVEEVVDRWQGPLYGYARRIVRNDADAADLTQEILLTLHRQRERYDSSRPYEPWMWRIATNVVYRHLRDGRLRREREREAGEMREQARTPPSRPDEDAEHAETCRAVQQALSTLSDEHRVLLVTHCVHGQSLGDIAAASGLPKSTVQSRVERALAAIRVALAGSPAIAGLPDGDVGALLASFPAVDPPPGLRDAVLRATRDGALEADAAAAPSAGTALRRTRLLVAAGVCTGLLGGVLVGRTWLGIPSGGTMAAVPAPPPPPPASAEPTLTRIVLAARDTDACARFYTAMLGMEFKAAPMGDLRFYDGRLGTLAIRIFPASIAGIEAKDNRQQLGFRVTDVRATLARALAAGGTMDPGWEVISTPNGPTVALRDPDGNSVELFEGR